jgi:hypothetical protein
MSRDSDHEEAVEAFLDAFRVAVADDDMPDDYRTMVTAYLEAIDAQRQAASPNRVVLRECLRSLRSIAESLAGSGVLVGLAELAQKLHF